MKKVLLLVLVAFISTAMSAQLVTSTTVIKGKKSSTNSGMFMEVGIGTLGSDWEGDGIALDLGLGYRKGFNENFAWDVLKVKAIAELANFGESLTPQVMTGIRATSPALIGDMTAFGSFSLGYGYNVDVEEGGFAYEIQAGLNITSKLYAGIVYDNQSISFDGGNANVSFTGLRLGLRF